MRASCFAGDLQVRSKDDSRIVICKVIKRVTDNVDVTFLGRYDRETWND